MRSVVVQGTAAELARCVRGARPHVVDTRAGVEYKLDVLLSAQQDSGTPEGCAPSMTRRPSTDS